jgi:hypothetical protein
VQIRKPGRWCNALDRQKLDGFCAGRSTPDFFESVAGARGKEQENSEPGALGVSNAGEALLPGVDELDAALKDY